MKFINSEFFLYLAMNFAWKDLKSARFYGREIVEFKVVTEKRMSIEMLSKKVKQ